MRYVAMFLLFFPCIAGAQARQGELQQSSLAASGTAAMSLALPEDVPDVAPAPLARSSKDARILSKNEAYNRGRVAEGRLGTRLGNDESYRITGN